MIVWVTRGMSRWQKPKIDGPAQRLMLALTDPECEMTRKKITNICRRMPEHFSDIGTMILGNDRCGSVFMLGPCAIAVVFIYDGHLDTFADRMLLGVEVYKYGNVRRRVVVDFVDAITRVILAETTGRTAQAAVG